MCAVTTAPIYIPPACDNKAKDGDIVTVNYRGTFLNGTLFDTTYNEDDPITFTIGSGEVIHVRASHFLFVQMLPRYMAPFREDARDSPTGNNYR